MNESGRKKREWVKTAAIVFLSVMLVLTFFSSTIQNWSLPEVATQYVQSGTITAKATITGNIESVDPYEVKVTESRKVASVAVRTGTKVQKGDVLIYLEDKDSKELEDAKKSLEAAKAEYNKAILSDKYTAADISDANKGVTAEEYRERINRAQDTVKAAEKAVKNAEDAVESAEGDIKAVEKIIKDAEKTVEGQLAPYKAEVERINQQIQDYKKQISYEQSLASLVPQGLKYAETERENAEKALPGAEEAWNSTRKALEDAKKELDDYNKNPASAGTGDKRQELEDKVETAQVNYNIADWNYTLAKSRVEEAKAAYNDLINEQALRENTISVMNAENAQLEIDLYNAQKAQEAAEDLSKKNLGEMNKELEARKDALEARKEEVKARQKELTEKKTDLSDLVSKADNVTGLQKYLDAIKAAQNKVDELSEKAGGTTITAPIAGTVTTINVTAGNETSAAVPVVVMQREGQGFTLKYSATNEVAKRLSVGDVGQLVNAWKYDDVTVTLDSIKPDPDSRGQNKLLTFNVTGSVVAGQSLSFTVGQKSANYNFIVPNSAIREDNNGKFILIVVSKSSPLGTRYTASRVDVEVIANDETQSAVTGALSGYEFVITTSTKPVVSGNLVRLPD